MEKYGAGVEIVVEAVRIGMWEGERRSRWYKAVGEDGVLPMTTKLVFVARRMRRLRPEREG